MSRCRLRLGVLLQLSAACSCFRSTSRSLSQAFRQSSSLHVKNKPSSVSSTSRTSRINRISSLTEWAKQANIQLTTNIKLQEDSASGLGWFAGSKATLPSNSVLLTVPSNVALTVEAPGAGPDDASVRKLLSDTKQDFPWYIQMAIYIHKLDRIDSQKSDDATTDMRPWLNSLPRRFDTPIHWTKSSLDDLQYNYLQQAVQRQEQDWRRYWNQLTASASSALQQTTLDWDSFLWATEIARSRAFSGAYTGSAFNPLVYAFTMLLVTAYVGLGLGTLEQAANGAGVVLCASVLKDFVVPKLFKTTKRYVICPMIDMANHDSLQCQGDVSFEYFGNAYSLATTAEVAADQQVFISYGARSNDQLLQYYGFVETDNPHDVYIMPALRDWDLSALELACGRTFADGRLIRLERAGLLGGRKAVSGNEDDEDARNSKQSDTAAANSAGGVVITRVAGIDPAVLQALRALVSNDEEWSNAGEAVGNFCQQVSDENEACARAAARRAMEMELSSKRTTLKQDRTLLKQMRTIRSLDASRDDKLALLFRIEKKKLLMEAIDKLS
jgi:hypothetical protein